MTESPAVPSMADRYGSPPKGVTLTGKALIKGLLISSTCWIAGLLIVVWQFSPQYLGGFALMILIGGYGVAMVVGAPLAVALAYVLRPVRNQWIHLAAFFAGTTLVFWVLGALAGFGWFTGSLGVWASVGLAAAIGRLAIWKDVSVR
ncbi:hypothetical protein [Pseudarthrobacter siccitolerans]